MGIRSAMNDDPLSRRYATGNGHIYRLEVVSDEEAVALLGADTQVNAPVYFSAILSNDRETIYWVNYSRPLPD